MADPEKQDIEAGGVLYMAEPEKQDIRSGGRRLSM